MRIDKLTSKLQSALADAQSMALGKDHNLIEPAHLMLALIDQKGGSVRPLLSQTGFNVAQLHEQLVQAVDDLPQVANSEGEISVSPDLGKLLNQADKLAQQKGDSFISRENILMVAM
ncbi:MAG: type VI secretion system ATPase TssH, partial [Gammaproteobacteria bacterium]|nr:type VI secretion system ATPase TssH [Gammaproteobacteria bacterium]